MTLISDLAELRQTTYNKLKFSRHSPVPQTNLKHTTISLQLFQAGETLSKRYANLLL